MGRLDAARRLREAAEELEAARVEAARNQARASAAALENTGPEKKADPPA